MKKEFKTLKGLVNFVKKYLIEEYGSLEEIKDCSIIELIDKKIEQIIRDYAEKYVNISYKEERILTNKIEYADSFEDLQYYLVCDVLEYMMVGVEKTLNQVKKEYLED